MSVFIIVIVIRLYSISISVVWLVGRLARVYIVVLVGSFQIAT